MFTIAVVNRKLATRRTQVNAIITSGPTRAPGVTVVFLGAQSRTCLALGGTLRGINLPPFDVSRNIYQISARIFHYPSSIDGVLNIMSSIEPHDVQP